MIDYEGIAKRIADTSASLIDIKNELNAVAEQARRDAAVEACEYVADWASRCRSYHLAWDDPYGVVLQLRGHFHLSNADFATAHPTAAE